MSARTIAVVGATGAVGEEIRSILLERQVEADHWVFLASARSAGRSIDHGEQTIEVRDLASPNAFDGVNIALFSAGGSRSLEYAPKAVEAGALVVDNSSAFRSDPDVPLVVAEVNADALDTRPVKGIVANPNCTTMAVMLPMKALHDAFGLTEMVCSTYQAAGGAGQSGIDELHAQVDVLIHHRDALRHDGVDAIGQVTPEVFMSPLAYNVVPMLGNMQDNGYTDEELKLLFESRKILGIPALKVAPTCVRVPVVSGHAISVRATFAAPVTREAALEAMSGFDGMVLDEFATPLAYAGGDPVAVGRVRQDLFDDHTLNLWVVGDNLRKGAALNAVQIAEALIERGHA
ncbi:aspartate-semialdehyde dehydrogenase [Stomatohabitans albus]|uniref:aspartate-semialdehyde dehydrogenase n=1 Tax=Stomatohabitans albus TaxID=3110766 RepID=UPI00300C6513